MTISSVEFASLLCSRLCHDLLSPVGALNNGIELLADEQDPQMRQRCLELLADSARASANKLKFFRLAFGAAGGFGDAIDTREARAAIEGLFGEGHRVRTGWLVEVDALPKQAVKILLNLALIAGEALVRGGELDIGAEIVGQANGAGPDGGSHDGQQVEIVVRATGPRIILDQELRTALMGGGDGIVTPRAAAAHLVHALVTECRGEVRVSDPADPVLLFGATLQTG